MARTTALLTLVAAAVLTGSAITAEATVKPGGAAREC